ncbi:MAG: HPr(Ser) kinase/phosphatase, partial [Oscillospiraceae bacterium]
MENRFKTSLKKLMGELALETIYMPREPEELFVYSPEANRPGLALAGFFEIFDKERIQVFGRTELTYLKEQPDEIIAERLNKICSYHPPLIVITSSQEIPKHLLEAAKANGIAVCRTDETSCDFMASVISVLSVTLAPRITRHGVFMEVLGEGVLILGESGVGKSETALELIARGHRLVADDAVEIRRVSGRSLVGCAPENIRHFMELRGIGVVNVRKMFGMGAVKITEKINLIISLEPWDDDKVYDRLGAENL